ncbi:hypothetical protein [Silvibacterium dinghuense]|uniref:Uncharacterized protein n=1 Tax=Silvibacterium dinghuense TaxID=1560006 RepID=A0A4Q1S9K0_9BACT|nr:hypothetical protein [Silvibacterium dinghuense]RXS93708.1 hypothetical protein ESZ00_16785 [Silvibacterium dinghuense]GGH07026.1 hypothetical protein GCM10011586_24040 [Silvibacterium dinghuense]
MANPSNTTITIDGTKLNAFSTNVGISSHTGVSGMPSMGSMICGLHFSADMHDTVNIPFTTVKQLFDLANLPTRDKIKDIKIEFWQDDSKADALCSIAFKGWISSWNISSGGGSNHVLSISLQPALDQKNYYEFQLGN